jgi:hypothetical protein
VRRARRGRAAEGGQAGVELLGSLPVVLVLGLACFQLLAVGYALVLAGNAAEAGARAVAAGGNGAQAARDSLPGWSRARGEVDVDGGRVNVRLRPPSPLRAVSRRLEVRASAAVER